MSDHRWQTEAAFFDAVSYNDAPYSEVSLKRYLELQKPYHSPEYFYSVMGKLKGKTVLDIGCGSGDTSLVLAAHGADVLGIDLSAKAISAAQRRANRHSFAGNLRFECQPLESYVITAKEKFDIICGHSILHHLLPVLGEFLNQSKKLSNPWTQFVFLEPMATSEFLRKLRLKLPVSMHGTEGERPLNKKDLKIISEHLPAIEVTYFECFNRFTKFCLNSQNYEDSHVLPRRLYDTCGVLDRILLQKLKLTALGSIAVLHTPQCAIEKRMTATV